ncbi:MAG: carbamoyltransferase HypF [Candidatus Nanopelagicales bacterium]
MGDYPDESAQGGSRRRCAVRVTGVVQGVGFRPFVNRLAAGLGLAGHVGNDAEGVFIVVEGRGDAVAEFLLRLRTDAPALAVVDDVVVADGTERALVANGTPDGPRSRAGFRIAASPAGQARSAATSIPPDTAVCTECLAEMRDPSDRRYGYPFIACSNCGPRFTIVTGLPYDRQNTTMIDFPLCPACRTEYEDPASRRFHAQPTACRDCGPSLSMPVAEVAAALRSGAIVAIKGVGGYHLACDSRDAAAVTRLRRRKRRGDKPFAVMVRDLATARELIHLGDEAVALLTSPARPVLLADSRDPDLQALVAPGNSFLGLLLPYAPLHHLLFDAGAPDALVMTSGNLSDEPICTDPGEAEARLGSIADVFCHHDRRIHAACDDSVVRMVAGRPQPVRRSRGYAPLPVTLPLDSPPLVAVGGELKATAGVAAGRRAWLSQHIGDTESLETLDLLAASISTLVQLQQVDPVFIVSDAHPGYLSHRWAARHARDLGVAHLVVQHHHAHLASLLAEHRIEPTTPVLGVVFDGTGYGCDATIWGGELLLGNCASVKRVGHLRPVLLPGGDAAVRSPARAALAHLTAAGLPAAGTASAESLADRELRLLDRMLATGSHCVPTTSAGRLFDAVSSLLGVRQHVDYEAQAAIELEALAARAERRAQQPPSVEATTGAADASGGALFTRAADASDDAVVIDPRPWIARAVADHAAGIPVEESARSFHAALAVAVTRAAVAVRDTHGVGVVGLTGGVFSNAVLSRDCLRGLAAAGFTVLTHTLVPPNDGGLALGQIAVAAAGGALRATAPA